MKIKINKDLIEYEENDEVIIVNMRENYFHALDYISSVFWKIIKNNLEIQAILSEVYKTFDADHDVLRNDTNEFIIKLSEVGIIEIH